MPHQYETMIVELGDCMSGGECQRLCIDRALLKDSPIVILDEATSSLDSESERLIQDALDPLVLGRTPLRFAQLLPEVSRQPEAFGLALEKSFIGTRNDRMLLFKVI